MRPLRLHPLVLGGCGLLMTLALLFRPRPSCDGLMIAVSGSPRDLIQEGMALSAVSADTLSAAQTGAPKTHAAESVSGHAPDTQTEGHAALRAGSKDVPAPPAASEGPYAGFCRNVMQRLLDSKPAAVWPPRCPVPADLKAAFERPDGSMPITRDWCLAQRYEGHKEMQWTRDSIEAAKASRW
jgi:hypothetical protein